MQGQERMSPKTQCHRHCFWSRRSRQCSQQRCGAQRLQDGTPFSATGASFDAMDLSAVCDGSSPARKPCAEKEGFDGPPGEM
jgi:hypothetical protein